MLMYLLEHQCDIFHILRDHYNNKKLEPFSNFLQGKYENIGMTVFMKNLYHTASEKMKGLFFLIVEQV